ncbi:MAG: DNA-binding protein [Stellaceae bacterium]
MQITKRLLTRKEASAHLKERGTPAAVATLNKLACVGGGPAFQLFGRRPLYDPDDLDAWADARLSKKVRSTSELPPERRQKRPEAAAGAPAADVSAEGA